jgi:protein FRG1
MFTRAWEMIRAFGLSVKSHSSSLRSNPSASMSDNRSSKLKFKGEKTKKKRRRDDDDENGTGSSSRRKRREQVEDTPETWVLPEQPIEIRGPTFIFQPSDPAPLCVHFDTTRNRITLSALAKDEEHDIPPLERVPTEVSQVWVVTRVAGSPTINLRTGVGEGKFLSCDKHGIVTADRDARGPQEEWTPVVFPDGMVAFQNVYEKYLSVDEVAGGQIQLRGDADTAGFNERFYVKVQSKYKREANEEEKQKNLKEGLAEPSMDEAGTKCVFFQRPHAMHV